MLYLFLHYEDIIEANYFPTWNQLFRTVYYKNIFQTLGNRQLTQPSSTEENKWYNENKWYKHYSCLQLTACREFLGHWDEIGRRKPNRAQWLLHFQETKLDFGGEVRHAV